MSTNPLLLKMMENSSGKGTSDRMENVVILVLSVFGFAILYFLVAYFAKLPPFSSSSSEEKNGSISVEFGDPDGPGWHQEFVLEEEGKENDFIFVEFGDGPGPHQELVLE